MLKYLAYHQIDFQKWDACINNSPNGIIYALSWYLDIVSPSWGAIIKEEQEEYTAVMPITRARKFGFSYVKQPVFAQQLGVFGLTLLSALEWQEITYILKKKFWFITHYEFNTANPTLIEVAGDNGSCRKFTTHHLNLQKSYDKIHADYKKGRKWQVNKSKRNELTSKESNNIDLLIKLFDTNTAGRIYGVIGEEYEYKILRQLHRATTARGMSALYEAVDREGEVLAMIMLFIYNKKIVYIFNASSATGKSKWAISFLLDSIIQKYANQEMCFDFESPEVANIARFYASFGSEEVSFASISMNNLPVPVKWMKTARTKIVRYFSG